MERSTVTKTEWFTPGVRGIGAASLLSELGHEVPTALLPRFITSLGGSAAVLGVIEGIADGLADLARLGGGALADDPAPTLSSRAGPGRRLPLPRRSRPHAAHGACGGQKLRSLL